MQTQKYTASTTGPFAVSKTLHIKRRAGMHGAYLKTVCAPVRKLAPVMGYDTGWVYHPSVPHIPCGMSAEEVVENLHP